LVSYCNPSGAPGWAAADHVAEGRGKALADVEEMERHGTTQSLPPRQGSKEALPAAG